MVELHGRSIDGVGDEKTKRDGPGSSKLDSQAQRLFEQEPAEALALSAVVDGEPGEKNGGDWKLRKAIERLHCGDASSLDTGRRQRKVTGNPFPSGSPIDGQESPREKVFFGMPEGVTLEILNE